jgi:hypothetical protein
MPQPAVRDLVQHVGLALAVPGKDESHSLVFHHHDALSSAAKVIISDFPSVMSTPGRFGGTQCDTARVHLLGASRRVGSKTQDDNPQRITL